MYITDKFFYIHLQKTGGTRITEILSQLTSGELYGPRHNYLARKPYSKLVFGSIRNPFDWYVSIFSFGCTGNGGMLGWLKDNKEFSDVYSNAKNIENFHKWLELIYSNEYINLMGNGYPDFSLHGRVGLMTWRYAYLYTEGIRTDECPYFENYQKFFEYLNEFCIVDEWIRLEDLSKTITKCLKKASYIVPKNQLDSFCGIKSNASNHLPTRNYYDEWSIELVKDKEKFIFDKFKYPILKLENSEYFTDEGILK